MTEESSTTSHLSVAIATSGITQVSTEMTSPPSFAFYFSVALLVIGLVGTATNGFVLYALVASKQHKKHVLIVNQNALDLFTSFVMVIVYSVKLSLTESHGYWLCTVIRSDSLIWWGTFGSVINLASITVHRYLKVVHYSWSKIKLKNWMIYAAMAFSWIGGFACSMALAFPTTRVIDGKCYPYAIWVNDAARIAQAIWFFVSLYVIILVICMFSYWRILVAIRRQVKVMAGHAVAGPSTAQTQCLKKQSSVMKTMILVCALYAIMWMPSHIYGLYLYVEYNRPVVVGIYYATSAFAFLYMCTNPFVYAANFDPVRKVLVRLITCKKNSE